MQKLQQQKTVSLLIDVASNLIVDHISPEFQQCDDDDDADDGDIFADNHCSTALSGG